MGPCWGPLGTFLGLSWAILKPSWAIFGPLGTILGHLGDILEPPWDIYGPSWASGGPYQFVGRSICKSRLSLHLVGVRFGPYRGHLEAIFAAGPKSVHYPFTIRTLQEVYKKHFLVTKMSRKVVKWSRKALVPIFKSVRTFSRTIFFCDPVDTLGDPLGPLGASWDHLGAILGASCANLRPLWANLGHHGPSWAILMPSWGHVGAMLRPAGGHLGTILGHFTASKGQARRSMARKRI